MILYKTDRTILRNYDEKDVHDLFEYMSSEFTALHEDFSPYTFMDCEKAIQEWQFKDCFWAVELINEAKVIGSLNYSKKDYNTYEIGYDFNEKYSGLGYATELVQS